MDFGLRGPYIIAYNDDYTSIEVNGIAGNPDLGNVLGNDNGNVSPTVADVDITVVTPADPVATGMPTPTFDPTTGAVSVPAGTPSGVYEIEYAICLIVAPVCDTAVIYVQVNNDIIANDDHPSIIVDYMTSAGVATTTSIFVNDSLGGAPLDLDKVTVTPGTIPVGFTLNPDGTTNVGEEVVTGTYTFTYEICETHVPANCSAATVTIQVINEVVACNDTLSIPRGTTGIDILTNDSFNGVSISDPSRLTISPLGSILTGLTLNPDGTVDIDPSIPVGDYEFDYEVCETGADPVNCTAATVYLTIETQLSINLLSFTAKNQNGTAVLHWVTGSEKNNKGFDVERSLNGQNWQTIGFVNSKALHGNSNSTLNYNFVD